LQKFASNSTVSFVFFRASRFFSFISSVESVVEEATMPSPPVIRLIAVPLKSGFSSSSSSSLVVVSRCSDATELLLTPTNVHSPLDKRRSLLFSSMPFARPRERSTMRPLFVRPSRPREFLLDEEEEGRNPIAHCKDNIFLSLFLSLSVCNNQTKKRERERDPSSLPPFCFFEVGSFLVRVCVCAKRARVLYKELFCVKRRDNCSAKNGGKRFGATLKKHAFFLFFFFLLLFDSLQNFLTSKKTTTTTAADSDDDDDDDESDDDDDDDSSSVCLSPKRRF